jgi:uncharacterized protein (TIGR03083 family)
MTDASDLQGLDPYDLMAEEAARLDRHFGALDEAGWARPSRCEGWTVRDVLAHLTASEEYNRACLDDTVAVFLGRLAERGVSDLNEANELGIRDLDGMPTDQLLDLWRTRAEQNREEFRARDGSDVDSSVGPYPARWQAFHLAFELAIHADDVGAPVDRDEQSQRTRWLAQFGRFALKEHKPEARTDAGNGATRVRGDGLDVTLPDEEFVHAAAGRVPDASNLDERARSFLAVT